MVFVETSLFTRLLRVHLDDESYRSLQVRLIERPDAGAVMRGTRGVRKMRWRAGGKGKSGGVRVIYYWMRSDAQIYFLTIYAKSEKENLTSDDLRTIAKFVEALKNG